jgi:hypothetical protein
VLVFDTSAYIRRRCEGKEGHGRKRRDGAFSWVIGRSDPAAQAGRRGHPSSALLPSSVLDVRSTLDGFAVLPRSDRLGGLW